MDIFLFYHHHFSFCFAIWFCFFVCFFKVENEMKGQLCRSNFECNSRKCLRFSDFLLLKEWGCFTCQKTCYVFFWQVKYLKIVFKKARKTSDIWNYYYICMYEYDWNQNKKEKKKIKKKVGCVYHCKIIKYYCEFIQKRQLYINNQPNSDFLKCYQIKLNFNSLILFLNNKL